MLRLEELYCPLTYIILLRELTKELANRKTHSTKKAEKGRNKMGKITPNENTERER